MSKFKKLFGFGIIAVVTILFYQNCSRFTANMGGTSSGASVNPTPSPSPTPTPTISSTPSAAFTYDKHILVDQFGYRPNDPKVAVIRTPHTGFDSASTFSPGTVYQLRTVQGDTVVFTGSLTAWNNGATDSFSGDSGWWFDFSSVTTPGNYYVADMQKGLRSATFNIAQNVYQNELQAVQRMYFYQREGIVKTAANAGACWQDGAAYVGANQDTQATALTNNNGTAPTPTLPGRDVSGGWMDAGDTNKYVTFARDPVHRILTAYQNNPTVFSDATNIPESGNGIPDVIDEVNWEIKWLLKMQNSDGSAALKVGVTGFPFGDIALITDPRYYIPTCSSATISVAGMFAHASIVFAQVAQQFSQASGAAAYAAEAATLKTAAINAWNNYQTFASTSTWQTSCDKGVIQAGNADVDAPHQIAAAAEASIYLFALTGDETYNTFLRSDYSGPSMVSTSSLLKGDVVYNYQTLEPYSNDFAWGVYNAHEGEALLYYASLPNATPSLATQIRLDYATATSGTHAVTQDLYRNYFDQYIWGSNEYRSNFGNLALSPPLEVIHYINGVNPFGMVYLTNMYPYGATSSVDILYHTWFSPGTKWSTDIGSCGPAPGYMPGGPNQSYDGSLTPPAGQPAAKSYLAENYSGQPQNIWEVSEPGIYYQAAFLKLLSQFAQ